MSEAREDQEAGQDVPLAVEESQQLVDAQVQPEAEEVKPEASSAPVPVEETSNHVENGKVEAPAEDQTVKPEANSEGIPQQDVQNTLHSVTIEANDQILNKAECEHASDVRAEAEGFPQSNKGNENDANDSKEDVDTAETAVEVKPEACEVADGKTCNNGDCMPSSHNKPMTPQPVHADTKTEIKNGLGVDNKANEKPSSHNEPITPQSLPADAKAEIKNGLEVHNKADEKPSSHNEPITPQSIPADVKAEIKNGLEVDNKANEKPSSHSEPITPQSIPADAKAEIKKGLEVDNKANEKPASHNEPITPQSIPADTKVEIKNESVVYNKANEKLASAAPANKGNSNSKQLYFLDADHSYDGNESGTDEDQSAFMKELENFFRERSMEFKPPKFYGEGLNCLKLWRAVTRLGGYDKVTSCKLWRQVGESFKPPKTCTTVSWTFRGFYEKALLDYERHKTNGGQLSVPIASHSEPMNIESQAPGSGRARRDAAARAMQGWHSQRLLGNGEVSDPIIKDRNSMSTQKREKQLKSINLLKRKKPSYMDNAVKAARSKPSKPQLDTAVVDIGPPADWVKVNVQKTKDCFEVYALVPGLLREEVRVQSDPAGRLVISGEPEHPDNPWGVTPFKKVVSLPSRIDPHQTSAVVTLHGQLFVRVPFEQSE